MLFNSIEFLLYLPVVFMLYWALRNNRKAQNWLMLIASYLFYGFWDYRFLSLIIVSSAVDYLVGQAIHESPSPLRKKRLMWLSVTTNLGILAGFKYFDFFIGSANDLFVLLGLSIQYELLELVFPVGISFYTFQTLSYTIDIYRGKIEPSRDPVAFFGFVSFFPQLVAGPIERAADLLPQFAKDRAFNYRQAIDGTRQILWGMFKKVVVADNAASIADQVFTHYSDASPGVLLLGASMFFVQVYGDFSGYSDIAIGTARLFGFELSLNFSTPFFSRSFSEFWRRWHITLNTWFRDYVYFPLGGSRRGNTRHLINISIVFVVCGFWHGAAWTFIFWGALNALYFVFEQKTKLASKDQGSLRDIAFPGLVDLFKMSIVFLAVAFSLVFFRSPDIASAFDYYVQMVDFSGEHRFELGRKFEAGFLYFELPAYLLIMLGFEWLNRDLPHGLYKTSKFKLLRLLIYFGLTLLTLQYFYGDKAFVYFQF